jgi:hypothetical protein
MAGGEILLRNARREVVAKAIVDEDDLPGVSGFRWHRTVAGYVARGTWDGRRRGIVLMHRQIMDPRRGLVVDHINGDPLDNRRANLRVCTQGQNSLNRSGPTVRRKTGTHRGVKLRPGKGNWQANITVGGKSICLGTYPTEAEASAAFEAAAETYRGNFNRRPTDRSTSAA